MPTRLAGTAFGPGFSTAGSAVEFDITDYGLNLVTAESFDGTPPWSEVSLTRQGFNAAQLLLEWPGKSGRYAISVTDAAAIQRITAARGPAAPVRPARADAATRAWVHGVVWATLVLPALLFAALLWQHDRIAGWAVARVPVAEERRLGEIFFERTKSRLKLVEGPATQMVREIGGRLTQGSAYTYEFYVAQDKSVNAFAMPGGFVVVHSGLLALASTPEEVAGVLAHEVRHVESRHSLRALVKSAGLSLTLSLIFGDTGGLVGLADHLLDLKFSRDHETQADRDGLAALVRANIRPQGMRDFFRKMSAQEKLDLGWLSSHPASAERFERMDAALTQLPAAALQAAPLAYDYAAIKAGLPDARAATPASPPKPAGIQSTGPDGTGKPVSSKEAQP